ncbi:MAG: hypothetical protein EBE86_007755 [Hormoscilla sp. GUM202]|nr:hypothetical protein [Hormoscilla sp. GUM202]
MKAVAIVDTSIFCEFLNIPNMNNSREEVLKEFERLLNDDTSFLLPMAAVYETGNHIAQLSDGGNRRRFAQSFVNQVQKAINGEAPWQIMQVPTVAEIDIWLSEFPDSAMQGVGMGDISIIKEWEKAIKRTPYLRVFIWSLDKDLMGYDYQPCDRY